MAMFTTIAAAAGLAMAIGGGTAKAISGGKQKRAAKRAARRFKRTELKNVHEGRSVITRGTEMALEENARTAATSMKALEAGGIRGVVGGSQGVQEGTNKLNQAATQSLDKQQFGIDRDKSRDELRIQEAKEARDTQELKNIQAQYNAGAQTQASGYGDIAQGAFTAAGSMFGASADAGTGGSLDFQLDPSMNQPWSPTIGAWSPNSLPPFSTTNG